MKNKKFLVAFILALSLTGITSSAEEPETTAVTETNIENTMDAKSKDTSDSKTNMDSLMEKNIYLTDIDGYKFGKLTKKGWTSEFLNLQFVPDTNITMGVTENDVLNDYYFRNSSEHAVAHNEMVAFTKSEASYAQVMVEVNPNHETASDVLARFIESENMDDASEVRALSLGDVNFDSVTGTVDQAKYLLAVADKNSCIIAVKIKYANAMDKRALQNCFSPVADEVSTEDSSELSTEELTIPDDFKHTAEEVQTEPAQ